MDNRIRSAGAIAVAVALLACGSDATSSKQVLDSVVVEPRDAVLTVGTLWPHMHQTALDRTGVEIKTTGEWSSSNEAVATVGLTTGAIAGIAIGTAIARSTVTYNGVTETGDATIEIVAPSDTGSVTATVAAAFTPQLRSITRAGSAGTLTWNFQAEPHTVTWDSQPPGAAVADIPASSNVTVTRDFPVAGTYEYHCAIHSGMTGSLLVQ
jgi:plastocyanin